MTATITPRRTGFGFKQNVTTAIFLSVIVLGIAQSVQPMRWILLAAIVGCVVFTALITIDRNEHGFWDWSWAIGFGLTVAGIWALVTHLSWIVLRFLAHL